MDKFKMMKVDVHLQAFEQAVAVELKAFEQAVAVEQAELRDRMIQQRLEIAKIRARIRLLESKVRLADEAAPGETPTDEGAAVGVHRKQPAELAQGHQRRLPEARVEGDPVREHHAAAPQRPEVERRLLESKHVSAVILYGGEDFDAGEPLAGDSTAGGEVQLAALRRPRRPRFGRCWPHTSRRRLKY